MCSRIVFVLALMFTTSCVYVNGNAYYQSPVLSNDCMETLDNQLLVLPTIPDIPASRVHDSVYVETVLVGLIGEHRDKLKQIYAHIEEHCQ